MTETTRLPVACTHISIRIRPYLAAIGAIATVLCLAPALVYAQSPALFGGGGSPLSSKDPIDIAADVLDVDQQKQVAVFTGNVDAVQGDLHLRSDVLTVYYDSRDDASEEAAPKKDEATSAIGQSSDITKIRVTGNVVITSPEETATGDWALYDVATAKVTMGGDVVLTRGENILKGHKLIVDLETGQSKLEAAPNGEGEKKRIRGLLIPNNGDTESDGESDGESNRESEGEDNQEKAEEEETPSPTETLTGAITE